MSSGPTRRDLEAMLADIKIDLANLRREEAALEDLMAWVEKKLASYPVLERDGELRRSVSIRVIRAYVQENGRATAKATAKHFAISVGQARAKLNKLAEQGTVARLKQDVGPDEYAFVKPEGTGGTRPRYGGEEQPETKALRLVSGGEVPLTGKKHPKVRKRRAAGQGTRARRGMS